MKLMNTSCVLLISTCLWMSACKSGTSAPPDTSSAPTSVEPTAAKPQATTGTGASQKIDAPTPEPVTDAPRPSDTPSSSAEPRTYAMGEWNLVDEGLSKLSLIPRGKKQASKVLYDREAERAGCLEMAETPEEREMYEYGGSAKVLFVTETMAGYELDVEGFCGGAHPFLAHNFHTVKAKGGEEASLTDIALAEDIVKALDADPLIQQARKGDEETCLEAPSGPDLSNFAIKRIDHGDVEVVIALPYAYEVCRDAFELVTLTLPVRSVAVRKELEAAQDAGLLMGQLHQ